MCGSIYYSELNANIIGSVNSGIAGFITKLTRDMVPKYATFFYVDRDGGVPEIRLNGIAIDDENNIYSAGTVWVDDAPTINFIGAIYYKTMPIGGRDGYIVKVRGEDGVFKFGTFFGGENFSSSVLGHDYIQDIAIDNLNRVYIVGGTNATATNNFPFEELDGAYYQTNLSSDGGFIARFNDFFNLDWCTKYGGGSNTEVIEAISISDDNEIAIAGRSASTTSFIPTFSGTIQDVVPNGGIDWYLTVFENNGERIWGTMEGSQGSESKNDCDLLFADDNSLYFGASIFSTSGINFVDPGGIGYFNNTNSGSSNPSYSALNYGMLVHYDPETYNPSWRTLLMDGEAWNQVSSLSYNDSKLYVSGTTRDGSMPLQSISNQLYSGAKTVVGSGLNLEGYLMIFDTDNENLLHSSYFGGQRDDNQKSFAANDFSELFGFGYSKSRYIGTQLGIPLKDNGLTNSWYNDGEDYIPADAGYIFKWCLQDTPLAIEKIENTENQMFSIYPNPMSQSRNSSLHILAAKNKLESFRIVDYLGRVLYQLNPKINRSDGAFEMALPSLASGVYFVIVKMEGHAYSQKLVVTD